MSRWPRFQRRELPPFKYQSLCWKITELHIVFCSGKFFQMFFFRNVIFHKFFCDLCLIEITQKHFSANGKMHVRKIFLMFFDHSSIRTTKQNWGTSFRLWICFQWSLWRQVYSNCGVRQEVLKPTNELRLKFVTITESILNTNRL